MAKIVTIKIAGWIHVWNGEITLLDTLTLRLGDKVLLSFLEEIAGFELWIKDYKFNINHMGNASYVPKDIAATSKHGVKASFLFSGQFNAEDRGGDFKKFEHEFNLRFNAEPKMEISSD